MGESTVGRLGIGLWTFQSTASAPASLHLQYRAFAEDAARIEALGFHSAWVAEHRVWYDGWCPAPLHALALAAANTTDLRLGTAMLLLPQHDPVALARAAVTLDRLSGGRLELGVGLGYRDAEYDALGLRRDRRGHLMDAALEKLRRVWAGGYGDEPPVQRPGPPIWLGGLADTTLERAARGGHALLLPQTVLPYQLAAYVERAQAGRGRDAVVGVMRDVWVEDDERRSADFRRRLMRHYREEAGAWWVLRGALGFEVPDLLERQLDRVEQCALIGSADVVAEGIAELFATGVELVVLRPNFDIVDRGELHEQLDRIAAMASLLPAGAASL